jgi:hypothetical protein
MTVENPLNQDAASPPVEAGTINGQTATPPGGSASANEERVSVMYGDRQCTKCHYNLMGQPVLKEPHYGLFIVRCPECATVASMQEYPQLGRWANRWAVVLSLLWVGVMLAISAGAFPAMIGSTMAFSEEVSDNFKDQVEDDWLAWYEETTGAPPTTVSWWRPDRFDEYVAAGRLPTLWADSGGFWPAVKTPELLLYIVPLSIAFVYGSLMGVALIHRRRRTLALIALGVLIVGGTIYGAIWYQVVLYETINSFSSAAAPYVFLPLAAGALGAAWLAMLTGAMCGRSIARAIVRLLLPPRLRGSLAVLWTTDGLTPPLLKATVS